jgi:imidazolonepropionase
LRAKRRSHGVLLINIDQLLTLVSTSSGNEPRRGSQLSELGIVKNAAVLCVAGKISSVGRTKDALKDSWVKKNRTRIQEIDCSGLIVVPGFVDSHTHPAFIGARLVDFEQRISGASYEDIARAGGGIRSSTEAVRKASVSSLAQHVLSAFQEMATFGTTTVEAKSGYGLSVPAELKSLIAIRKAASHWPGTVISTLLGAHVVPREFLGRSQKYVEAVCNEMIPAVAKRNLAQFVDVFTEQGAFSPEDTDEIFSAATRYDLGVRAHVCQLHSCALASLLKYNPASFDHLDYVTDSDISSLAQRQTIATLVPAANYFLGLQNYPPARKLIDAGVPVALATDYNPGSAPVLSMPFVLSLACTHMKMSPAEAISAATINGAHALRLAAHKGTVEIGKDADLAAFRAEDYREIPYWIASNRCEFSIRNGVHLKTGESAFDSAE